MSTDSRIDLTAFSERIATLRNVWPTTWWDNPSLCTFCSPPSWPTAMCCSKACPAWPKRSWPKTLSHLLRADFRRIQFTPDLMPTDVLGTSIFNLGTQQFDFHPGPVFTQVLLVDEINRAPAKTQAALFEVMEERQVTLDGKTRKLDPCYLVIATQNPVEQEGTYRLPEAQLDRFLLKIDMGYPSHEEELEILSRYNAGVDLRDVSALQPVISAEELLEMRKMLPQVVADERILHYITGLIEGTRTSPLLDLGASAPRLGCALALRQGRGAARRSRLRDSRRREGSGTRCALPPPFSHARCRDERLHRSTHRRCAARVDRNPAITPLSSRLSPIPCFSPRDSL